MFYFQLANFFYFACRVLKTCLLNVPLCAFYVLIVYISFYRIHIHVYTFDIMISDCNKLLHAL